MAGYVPALDFLEFKAAVLSTHPGAGQNHKFEWLGAVEGQQQIVEPTPVVSQQSWKLDRLVLVGKEFEVVRFAGVDGAVTALEAREDALEAAIQSLPVGGPHADVPMGLVKTVLPTQVEAAEHYTFETSFRQRVLEPPVQLLNLENGQVLWLIGDHQRDDRHHHQQPALARDLQLFDRRALGGDLCLLKSA